MNYKISVIIPTYNRAHTIKDAINSVLNQTYSNWECIIIDDGSADYSERIINDFITLDKRIKFLKRPPSRIKGAATCRNIGLENATGDYIQFLDSDDFIATNKFESQLQLLTNENLSTIGTCRYGIMKPIWEKPKLYYGLAFFKTFKNPLHLFRIFATNFSYFPLHVYLIPSVIIQKAGKWNEELTVNDDGEYFSRVIMSCSKITFCENTYAVYRTSAGNRISSQIMKVSGVKSYIESWNLIEKNISKKTGSKNHLYVRAAKSNIYKRLLKENPNLIAKNSIFLEDRWTNPSYFTAMLINKIRTKLLVSLKSI